MPGKNAEPVFIASSYLQFLYSVVMRLLIVAGIIYCGFHFEENPNVLGTLAVILFIFLTLIGHEQIFIYEDKIIERSDSLVGWLFKWKHREISMSEIIKATLVPEQPVSTTEKRYLLILSVLFKVRQRRPAFHPVLFEMKNGETWFLHTDTGLSQRTKIVQTVNEIVARKKVIR